MLRRLRHKFITVFMVAVTLLLCLLLGLLVNTMRRSLEYQSTEMLQAIANEPPKSDQGWETPEILRLSVLKAYVNQQGAVELVEGDMFLTKEEVSQASARALLCSEQSGTLLRDNLRFYKSEYPDGQVVVLSDMSVEHSAIHGLIRGCAIVGGVVLCLFFGLSVLLVNWMLRPVELSWQQQKQFVADASHELKTPLTVIMTNAELLQEGTYSNQEKSQFLSSIVAMSAHMRSLVEGMLELARVDDGAVKTGFGPVDMTSLVSDGILPFEALYFERGLTLNADVEPGITLQGSEQYLSQILEILLDNAMKYSAAGGSVQVRLRRQGIHCILTVASPGNALSPEEQMDIFKRFYRVDKARSRDGSYGLGLSIAYRIVSEHGGKIWAESANGMNTFSVQLPFHG